MGVRVMLHILKPRILEEFLEDVFSVLKLIVNGMAASVTLAGASHIYTVIGTCDRIRLDTAS